MGLVNLTKIKIIKRLNEFLSHNINVGNIWNAHRAFCVLLLLQVSDKEKVDQLQEELLRTQVRQLCGCWESRILIDQMSCEKTRQDQCSPLWTFDPGDHVALWVKFPLPCRTSWEPDVPVLGGVRLGPVTAAPLRCIKPEIQMWVPGACLVHWVFLLLNSITAINVITYHPCPAVESW